MRCPECQHDQKYKEGARCKKCHYQFVFRKKNDQISDFTLRQMIQRLSDNGQYAFTATQLALEICRLWRKKTLGPVGCGIIALVLSVIAGLIAFDQWHWLVGVLLLAIVLPLAVWLGQRGKNKLSFSKARGIIDRYHQAHPIDGLADGMAFRRQTPVADFQDPHYAPERILLVERDDLVDMLIRNRFHLTAKAAVVSRTGYPNQVFAACREFLRHHPSTPVQVVHDASNAGFALTAQLAADSKWQFARQQLVDLGISRTALEGNRTLPWLPADQSSRDGAFGGDTTKRLRIGCRIPVDYVGPKPMLNLLGAAVVAGALLLAPEILNASGAEVEIDYG
ncbi:MAG: hypothetical protein H6974_12450 [Gammaproteobacteria bacterium]|nr:hypothetical protein [Gammaproteobacteria bacterium]